MTDDLRELRRRARALRPIVRIGRAGLTDSLLQQVRAVIRQNPLMKVRVQAGDRQGMADLVRRLAQAVPCQVIANMGFTAVLYAPPAVEPSDAGDSPAETSATREQE